MAERLAVTALRGQPLREEARSVPDDVPRLLAHRAGADGERIAVVGNDGTGTYISWTYAEFYESVTALSVLLAERIADAGLNPAVTHVVWLYDNSSGALAYLLHHAVLHAGAVSVPLNPAQTEAELQAVVTRVPNRFVVAPTDDLAAAADPVAPRMVMDSTRRLPPVGSGRHRHGPTNRSASQAESRAVVLFTSGTTGRSKGVVHSHRSALAAGSGWRHAFQLTNEDVYQSAFPIYAGAGLHFNGLSCLLAGATFVIDEPRPTAASLTRVAQHRSTVYAAVPSVYEYWLAELDRCEHDLRSLRLLDYGGAVMRKDVITALRTAFPAVELVQTYGLTEAGPGGMYLPSRMAVDKLGSIGTIPAGDLQFDVDVTVSGGGRDGTDLVGELIVSGTSVMTGYLDDPEATTSVFTQGWLRTGDLVRRDASGAFFLMDRIKDLILRGGTNISSIELEEVLLGFPGVVDVAVFGRPHDQLGETVSAAIAPADMADFDLSGFKRLVEATVSRHKVPSHLLVVSSLPYSSAGKVLKAQLRASDGFTPW